MMTSWLLWIPAQAEASSLNALIALERTGALPNESLIELPIESTVKSIQSIDYVVSPTEAKGVAKPRKNSRDILQAARQRQSALRGVYPTALEAFHSAVLIRTTQVKQQIEQMTIEKLNKKLNLGDRFQQTYQTSAAHFKRFLAYVVEGIAVQAHQIAEKLR